MEASPWAPLQHLLGKFEAEHRRWEIHFFYSMHGWEFGTAPVAPVQVFARRVLPLAARQDAMKTPAQVQDET